MRKKIFMVVLALILFSLLVIMGTKDIKVEVDEKPLTLDVPPALIQGRALVPLEPIFEALGATINWEDETKTVVAIKGDTQIMLTTGSKLAQINGEMVEIEVPVTIIKNRLLVPVRFVAEALGAKVDWNRATKTVMIKNSEVIANRQGYDILRDGVITFDDDNFGYAYTQIETEPSKYNGKKVIITGFVFRKPDFQKNEFKVARKESSGCAADAYVLGLMCHAENAIDLEKDQWVTVKGTLVVTSYIDPKTNIEYEKVYIQPESIEKIPNRSNYYIY